MKTKTTIITLAALSLGIAVTQAEQPAGVGNSNSNGSGVIVTLASADSQHQHADGATLTFTPVNIASDGSTSDIWCYKVKGYTSKLTTPDNKQHQGVISGTIGTWEFLKVDKPAQRMFTEVIQWDESKLLSGKDLQIVFSFTNAAALSGTIDLEVDVYQNEPKNADLNSALEAPVYALADSQPVITWSLDPTFTEN